MTRALYILPVPPAIAEQIERDPSTAGPIVLAPIFDVDVIPDDVRPAMAQKHAELGRALPAGERARIEALRVALLAPRRRTVAEALRDPRVTVAPVEMGNLRPWTRAPGVLGEAANAGRAVSPEVRLLDPDEAAPLSRRLQALLTALDEGQSPDPVVRWTMDVASTRTRDRVVELASAYREAAERRHVLVFLVC